MGYKRYEKYKDSGVEWIGEIPEEWNAYRLKNSIKSCKTGIWGDEPEGNSNDISCIRVTDFNRVNMEVSIDNLTLRSLPKNKQKEYLLKKGDLLIEKSGGGEKQPVGFVVAYNHDLPAIYSNFIARMELDSNIAHPGFFKYVHAAMYSIRLNTRSIKQTTGIQNLDTGYYFNEIVPYPPVEEQNKICAFLDQKTGEIDSLIANKEKLIQLLQEKRQAIITEAVTKGLDPNVPMKDSGVEWIGEIPEGWSITKIKYICSESAVYGLNETADNYEDDGVRLIRTTDINEFGNLDDKINGVFISEEKAKGYILKTGDILLSRSGSVGLSLYFDEEKYGKCSYASYLVKFRTNRFNCPRYLFYFTKSDSFYHQIQTALVSSTISNFNGQKYANIKLPLPSYFEQTAIANFLDQKTAEIDSLIADIQTQIAKLKEYRQSLIYEAVTGKIDVRNL
ncbi:MAG: type restriction enzyme subunit [Epulopiscium sp.]|nr:type restriction enzyme subunit [Candidatus Epulonipiscium sp.]